MTHLRHSNIVNRRIVFEDSPTSSNPIKPMQTSFLRKTLPKYAVCVAATIVPLSLHAQTTWNGSASTNYGTAGNWTPGTAPGVGTDVLINTSTPNATIVTGNLDRRGAGTTTIDGTGNLTVNGRFLQGGGGAFNVLAGSLTVNGEYFMTGGDAQGGAPNGPGVFNQSGGTVTANLLRSWHLSDNNLVTSGSSYNLTGGTLTVNSAASTAVGEDLRGVWLGKGGAGAGTMVGDNLNIAGGTATFTRTSGNEANVRISRNSNLSVTSGSVTFANYSNFWVGQGANGSTNNRILVNGGSLIISGSTNLYLGREDDGKLTINSGVLNLDGTLFLGGDGTGAFDGIGTATMTGGSFSAANITALNAGSTFTYSGGIITLQGDRTSVISQTWWSGAAQANYDPLSNTTLITAVPEPSSLGLAVVAGLGLLVMRRRQLLRQNSL